MSLQRQDMKMMDNRWFRLAASVGLAALIAMGTGCGDEPERQPKLNVHVFGWGPDEQGNLGFQSRLPSFAGADQVRVSLRHPATRALINESTFTPAQEEATMPKLSFGDGLRLDFELLNRQGLPVAAGATPLFSFSEDDLALGFKIQVGRVNSFAPVGSVVKRDDRSQLTQSRMDYRRVKAMGDDRWLGRVGHATVRVDGGNKALVVGGGYSETSSTPRPGSLPEFTEIHDDVVEFDPVTGYFTDLAYNPQTRSARENGADRLLEARAYHTVTPIGDDRFLVVGGLTPNEPSPRVLRSIELIDLNAAPGTRVQQLEDPSGVAAQLNEHRAYHTATYRPADNTVVVTGGVGRGGSDVLSSIEIINLDTGEVNLGPEMRDARAEHEAVLMGDRNTIWILGGRDADGAVASTESLSVSGGTNSLTEEGSMSTARFGFEAVRISPNDGKLVMVLGGYTDLDGAATDTYEMSSLGRGRFLSEGNWRLAQDRAYPAAFELENTNNIVVLGGRNDSGQRVEKAEVLEYGDIGNPKPYTAKLSEEASFNKRSEFTATQLSNGKILMVGGIGRVEGKTTAMDNAEYYTPLDAKVVSGASE